MPLKIGGPQNVENQKVTVTHIFRWSVGIADGKKADGAVMTISSNRNIYIFFRASMKSRQTGAAEVPPLSLRPID